MPLKRRTNSSDDDGTPRPPHPSLRHHRDRQRKLALQESRLIRLPSVRPPAMRCATRGLRASPPGDHRSWGPYCTPIQGPDPMPIDRPEIHWRLQHLQGPQCVICVDSWLVAPAHTPGIRRKALSRRDGRFLAPLGGHLRRGRQLDGAGAALPHHSKGSQLRSNGRNCRSSDDLTARIYWRHPQLGLPLLLAARRDFNLASPDERWVPRRSVSLAQLAASSCGWQSRPDADHVWPRG